MGAYGRVGFMLCTVYILKLASDDNVNIVMASTISTISPSVKPDLVVSLTAKNRKECDVYSCSYQVISI